jgi:hypothetical protein
MINDADTVGVQIGLLNSAKKISGFQLGLVNVSDTASGIVLGLLNVVTKGYHVLEVSNNDGIFFNLAYKTGTRKFYTNYSGSIRADTSAFGQQPFWSLGLGFGSWIPLPIFSGSAISKNERWRLTLDVTVQHFSTGVFSSKWGHEVFRFAPALNVQLSKKLGLAIAPTFNAYSSNTLDASETAVFRQKIVPPNTLGDVRQSGKWTYWFGGYAALRFF